MGGYHIYITVWNPVLGSVEVKGNAKGRYVVGLQTTTLALVVDFPMQSTVFHCFKTWRYM